MIGIQRWCPDIDSGIQKVLRGHQPEENVGQGSMVMEKLVAVSDPGTMAQLVESKPVELLCNSQPR